jgi:hypothetical protein
LITILLLSLIDLETHEQRMSCPNLTMDLRICKTMAIIRIIRKESALEVALVQDSLIRSIRKPVGIQCGMSDRYISVDHKRAGKRAPS